MISLGDLGIKPVNDTTAEVTATTPTPDVDEFALTSGSILARALMHTWSGDRLIAVDSPPGAGKTTLIIDLVRHLLHRTELTLVVACPTKRGMFDMAERLVAAIGVEEDSPKVVFSHNFMKGPTGTVANAFDNRCVIVRTVASCANTPPETDILIVDEAFQSTFASVYNAAGKAQQILMVGDPGQIGPVNRVPSQFWDTSRVSPASRAPEGFAAFEGIVRMNLDLTYRVGQTTVDVIAPMYDFEFTSGRPDRWMLDPFGARMPEIETVQIPVVEGRANQPLMKAIAQQAVDYIGRTVVDGHDEDGNPIESVIGEHDIAIVVAHNDQAQIIGAYVNSLLGRDDLAAGEHRIYIGTADRAQGGQWKAVIAMDPIVGHDQAGSHQLAAGRLCVMLSRHTHHLTWLHDGRWEEKFSDVAHDDMASADARNDAILCLNVRRRLTSHDLGRVLTVAG